MSLNRNILSAVAVALVLALAGRASASELQKKMEGFAKDIEKLLKDQGNYTDVAIGEITGPPSPASASGPGLQKPLIEELAKLKIKVNDDAFIIIKGEYQPIEDEQNKDALLLQMTLSIKTKKGKKVSELTATLNFKANTDIVKILGMNADLSEFKNADPLKTNEQLKKNLEKPPLDLDKTKVKANPKSEYAVEVLVQKGGKGQFVVAQPKEEKGQAFIDLERGDVYRLRLTNTTKLEAAVAVTIDGLDAFRFFEPEKERPAFFLVAPTKSRDIEGWPRSKKGGNEFLVGSLSQSPAAAALKGSNKLGTINVCFHPAWEGKDPPPEYEGARSLDPNATTFGKEYKREVEVKRRTIGPLLTAVTIRYNK